MTAEARRAGEGLSYRVIGAGEPLLLLHGLLATGAMFEPLCELLQADFRMIVPDLRGFGASAALAPPYDVPALAADLGAVLDDAGVGACAVLGYSHGGAVAQQFAHTRPDRVSRLILACTYACNVATPRERLEAEVLQVLLRVMSVRALVNLVVPMARTKPGGAIGLTVAQAAWLRDLMGVNDAAKMREACRALITFDSRSWLGELRVPTLVVGGTHDDGVPRHHFETLLHGIPSARGRLVDRAGHMLIWTHTQELAEIVRAELTAPSPS